MAKVAIIDDSELILSVTCDLLEAEGHETVPIDTPIGATMRLAQNKPDLILVDLKMASLSGEQVVAAIRRASRLVGIKIILFSGESQEVLREATERCGADGYFQKSNNPEALAQAIEQWLPASG